MAPGAPPLSPPRLQYEWRTWLPLPPHSCPRISETQRSATGWPATSSSAKPPPSSRIDPARPPPASKLSSESVGFRLSEASCCAAWLIDAPWPGKPRENPSTCARPATGIFPGGGPSGARISGDTAGYSSQSLPPRASRRVEGFFCSPRAGLPTCGSWKLKSYIPTSTNQLPS